MTRGCGMFIFAGIVIAITGCGTTRTTDTPRAATEMLLVSNAIDHAVDNLDFSPLNGRSVFLDTQYLGNVVDQGYLVSSVRQRIASQGGLLKEKSESADFVIELRSGGVGTDNNSLLVGVPQMNLPVVLPGQPSQIPEIPVIKKTDQLGVAKLAVFIYERETGRAVWQSGTLAGGSSAKDTWVMGAGPIRRGTVNAEENVDLGGIDLNAINPFAGGTEEPPPESRISVTATGEWHLPSKQPPSTRIASEPRENPVKPASAQEQKK